MRTVTRLPRPAVIATLAAGAYVVAGGWIHLRAWLDTYRAVPAGSAGAAVVRIGFPLNALLSVVLAVALVLALRASERRRLGVLAATALFQAGSLVALVLSRTGSVLGWSEPVWTPAAEATRAVALGALVCLALAAVTSRSERHQPQPALG